MLANFLTVIFSLACIKDSKERSAFLHGYLKAKEFEGEPKAWNYKSTKLVKKIKNWDIFLVCFCLEEFNILLTMFLAFLNNCFKENTIKIHFFCDWVVNFDEKCKGLFTEIMLICSVRRSPWLLVGIIVIITLSRRAASCGRLNLDWCVCECMGME